MEFLRFIFSGFWVWLGFIVLVSVTGGGVIELVKACKRSRKVTSYRVGQNWRVEIENASAGDVQRAIVSAAYDAPWKARGENGQEEAGG